MLEVALDMQKLFENTNIPICQHRSASIGDLQTLNKIRYSLTRRQCACLLAHSFFGSLKRPHNVQRNDFRFTVADLFMGTARSPNSAFIFLNYFTVLGKEGTILNDILTFSRVGWKKGCLPWSWESDEHPLCKVELVRGNINDCIADLHVDFANAFPGGMCFVMPTHSFFENLLTDLYMQTYCRWCHDWRCCAR